MNIKASIFYAKSLIFPKTEKKSSARRSFIGAVFCIGLSLIPLIVVINVTDGMIEGMTQRLIGLSSGHLQTYISPYYSKVRKVESFEKVAEEVLKIDGVESCYPEINLNALATANEYKTGAQIRAVPKDIFKKDKNFVSLFEFVEGSAENFGINKNIIIGKQLSEILNVKVGDSIRIITTKKVAQKVVPKLTAFTVCGIVSSGYQELDALWTFVSLEDAYENLPIFTVKKITKTVENLFTEEEETITTEKIESNANFVITINTTDGFSVNISQVQREVQKFFAEYANVYRWNQIHQSKFENFASTKVMLVFIMVLIVLVASINISSAIIMMIMERQKEIAILKSLGASSKGVSVSFLITGIACSIGGVIIGVPFGILISKFFNEIIKGTELILNFFVKLFAKGQIELLNPEHYIQNVEISISTGSVLLVCFGTIVLSVVVSLIPSIKAGKEKPLDILRKN